MCHTVCIRIIVSTTVEAGVSEFRLRRCISREESYINIRAGNVHGRIIKRNGDIERVKERERKVRKEQAVEGHCWHFVVDIVYNNRYPFFSNYIIILARL